MITSLQILLAYLGKIGLAMALGLILGSEREEQNKPAGIRDVTLATLGATLYTLIALELVTISNQLGMAVKYDMGRIIAYTIVAIGFLGSGVIMQHKNKLEGITTAGTLWCAVGLGICCGLGLYHLAILSAVSVYFILKLKHIRITFESRKKRRKICQKRKLKLSEKKS